MMLVEQFESDDDARDFLRELIRDESIEGAASGIAKQLLDKPGSLTDKQRYVLEEAVQPHVTPTCKRGGEPIPWSEMDAARDNGGLCNWCWHMSQKDD